VESRGGAGGGGRLFRGPFWLSQEDYERHVAVSTAWRNLQKRISRKLMPDGVTLDDVAQARVLLRLPETGDGDG
jgi:hypothetical protein